MRAEVVGDTGLGPALIYLPGMDGTGELLLTTSDQLARRFRLIRFRYVDEGERSSAAIYERLADTAASALAELGVERALVLAESFGGGVALQLALRSPAQVRGLALVSTFAWFPSRWRMTALAGSLPLVPAPVIGFGSKVGAKFAARWFFFHPRRDATSESAFARLAIGLDPRGFKRRLGSIRHLDLRERLGEVQVPCHLFASKDDRVVPNRETMATLLRDMPNATLSWIPRAGHIVLPLREEPWLDRMVSLEESCSA